ncbi:hypothetical protein [Peribacillus frigoritolerans]|uniref:hypothetical protein n=1 Tax=Peribacillus frigoritolerans TaxID=450367 RepID=UPI0020C11DCD|nr:hypothetical protein [Peribacillus frigoritolerans]MEE3951666.1 hypothetical protein [Peribacillus frigoritolerans]
MDNPNIDVFLRKVVLDKAYSNQMINIKTYNKEVYKLDEIEKKISNKEKQNQYLLQQSKKKLIQSL